MKNNSGKIFFDYIRYALSGSLKIKSIERRALVNLLTHEVGLKGHGYVPTITQISREVGSDKSNISKALTSLKKMGVIKIVGNLKIGRGKMTPAYSISKKFREGCQKWKKKTAPSNQFLPMESSDHSQHGDVNGHKRKESNLKNTSKKNNSLYLEILKNHKQRNS